MKSDHIPESMARWAGVGLVLMAVSQPSAALGGAGSLKYCATFTTCTAAVGSSTAANVRSVFQPHSLFYLIPQGLHPIVNGVSEIGRFDLHAVASTAHARAQSDFASNRAAADSGYAEAGTDDHGQGISAAVGVGNDAQSRCAWRDGWTFTNSGHLSATVLLDGCASDATNTLPSNFTLGPTLVASVHDRSGIFNEQRSTFASSLALDFDFVSGVRYVVSAELVVQARHGRTIDLYNTARLGGAVLSAGAQMNALSGHDDLAPVPEPGPALMWLGGLAATVPWSRRRLRPAEEGAWAHP